MNEIYISNFWLILLTDGWGVSCVIASKWLSQNLTDIKPLLVQVMAWCHQVTSHYLSQFYWYQYHSQLDSTHNLGIISVLFFLGCSLQDPHFKGNWFSCLLLSVQSTWFVPGEMWNWMWLSPGWSCTQQLVGWSFKFTRRTCSENTSSVTAFICGKSICQMASPQMQWCITEFCIYKIVLIMWLSQV